MHGIKFTVYNSKRIKIQVNEMKKNRHIIYLPKLRPFVVNKLRTPGRSKLDAARNIKQLKKRNIHEILFEDIITTTIQQALDRKATDFLK